MRIIFIGLDGSADSEYDVLSLAPTGNICENIGAHQIEMMFEKVRF